MEKIKSLHAAYAAKFHAYRKVLSVAFANKTDVNNTALYNAYCECVTAFHAILTEEWFNTDIADAVNAFYGKWANRELRERWCAWNNIKTDAETHGPRLQWQSNGDVRHRELPTGTDFTAHLGLSI